jgi:hypothetical protein
LIGINVTKELSYQKQASSDQKEVGWHDFSKGLSEKLLSRIKHKTKRPPRAGGGPGPQKPKVSSSPLDSGLRRNDAVFLNLFVFKTEVFDRLKGLGRRSFFSMKIVRTSTPLSPRRKAAAPLSFPQLFSRKKGPRLESFGKKAYMLSTRRDRVLKSGAASA